MADILRRILRKLSVSEDVIAELLKLNQKPNRILVTKLEQLEAIIFSDVDENDDISELREDIISMWHKHAAEEQQLLNEKEPNTTSKESPKLTTKYVKQMLISILLKLNATKSIIDELINMRPRKVKLPDLAEKLSFIEQNISDISKDETELLNDWLERTVTLWANYESAYQRKCEKAEIKSANQKATQASTSEQEIGQTKAAIIAKITNALKLAFNVESDEDIYSIEGLMAVITRAGAFFDSANEETSRTLESEMLNCALEKLPKDMVNAFRFQPQVKEYQTVHELKMFLQAAIDRFYDRVEVKDVIEVFQPVVNCDDSDDMSSVSRQQDYIPGMCYRCLKPGHFAVHCRSTNSTADFEAIEKMKIALKSHVKSVFAKFRPVDDVDSMKRLYLLLAKARVLPFPDQSFPGEICRHSFSLLSSENQEKFMKQFCLSSNKTLRNLCSFLQREIVTYFRSINFKYAEMLQKNCEKKLYCNDLTKFCNYCRMPGHIWDDCNERKAYLCLNCFQFGHNSKKCQNEIKIIGLEDLLRFDL